MDSYNNLHFFVIGHKIMICSVGYMLLMASFGQITFFSIIFHRIKVHLSNKTNLDSHNSFHFFVIGHYNHVFLIGIHDIGALVWQEKYFFPPFSIKSKFNYQLKQTMIQVTIYMFFVIGHYNHVLLIRIYDIDALVCQEKLSFPPFSLELKFIREMRQTQILIIISILFVAGTVIMFSSLGYAILMLWNYVKTYCFCHFPYY